MIWIKIKNQYHDNPCDIYIGLAYLSNENNSQSISEKIKNISDDIELIKEKGGEIILSGDFNARTGCAKDAVENDKFNYLDTESIDLPIRNSADHELNSKGKELLDICKIYDLCIINGRKTGDLVGNYTSFQPGGNSVIDYSIVSQSLFYDILSFNVGEFNPWISDHCPIHQTVKLCNTTREGDKQDNTVLKTPPTTWYWDEKSICSLEEHLKREEVRVKLNEITSLSDGDKMVKEINYLLTNISDTCGAKRKKNTSRTNSAPPWYDDECQTIKNNIKKTGKQLQKFPLELGIKESLYTLKKQHKKLVQNKKMEFKNKILDQVNNNRKCSRDFWKILGKLEHKPNENTFKSRVPSQKWINHFKSLFSSGGGRHPLPDSPNEKGMLDHAITSEELELACYILRPSKASGMDGICNEMILCLYKTHPNFVLDLFNSIFSSESPITMWNTSIISPIHKKGSKANPDNYRAISLICCMSKFYAAILNQRLLKFVVEKGIVKKNQLGFMPGNRTSDALIILYNLIDTYCKQNNKYIYACFVDFKKAFDSIPRHTLFEKLLKYNITGKFYNNIKNMYTNDVACISINGKLTESFSVTQGVKQGCILSPLLFNIFLSDLPESLGHNDCHPVSSDGIETLNSLIWADDLLILSETEQGLQKMLNNLLKYTKTNTIDVNLDKTNCMIFNKIGRLIVRNFWFGNKKIKMTREYKYLGFLVTPSLNLHTALTDLRDRGLKSYGALKSKLGNLFRKHINTTTHLFDSLVKPILLYGSDFWGCLKLPRINPVENLHIKFCKELLGLGTRSTNLGALLELGRCPLIISGKKNAIKNWERIAQQKNTNPIITNSYLNSIENGWASSVRTYLSSIGLMHLFLNTSPSPGMAPNTRVFFREKDMFQQSSLAEIKQMSKMRTYTSLKNNIQPEQYLSIVQNIPDRIALTRLRLSNHSLMIEKGRHQNITRPADRICPFCPGKAENELHFLLRCPLYANLRGDLITKIKTTLIGFFHPKDENFLFWLLLCCPQISKLTSRYIRLATELRAFLLENHRNSM